MNNEYPEQRKRMITLQTARSEMMKVIARQRRATPLALNVSTAADRNIAIGPKVFCIRKGHEMDGSAFTRLWQALTRAHFSV